MDPSGIGGQGGRALDWPICREIMPKRQSVSAGGSGLSPELFLPSPVSARSPAPPRGRGQGWRQALAWSLRPEPWKES